MKKKNEKTSKLKINKGKLATRIMAGILAMMMILSVCATSVYYFYTYFKA